jgi:hypothetical protein
MPFDSLVRDTVIDPLTRLGITPIPQETVSAYKKAYKQEWLRTHPGFRGIDTVRWRTARRKSRAMASVASFLINPLEKSWNADDRTGAPKELIDLAEVVRSEIPDADFSVEFFSTDPILQVEYACDGQRVKACLGIWEAGKIKMIARQEGSSHT